MLWSSSRIERLQSPAPVVLVSPGLPHRDRSAGTAAVSYAVLIAIALLTGLTGCARTHLLGSWQNPHNPTTGLTKVMVVNVTKDPKTRQVYEEHVVEKLVELGLFKTVPSFPVAPAKAGAYPDAQQLQEAITSSAVEAVLTTMVVWSNHHTPTQAGFVQPKPLGEGGWQGWQGFYERVFQEPSMPQVSNTAIMEGYLYDVRGDTLLWSGKAAMTTEHMRQTNGIASLAESLARNLLAKRFLTAMPK